MEPNTEHVVWHITTKKRHGAKELLKIWQSIYFRFVNGLQDYGNKRLSVCLPVSEAVFTNNGLISGQISMKSSASIS